MSHEIDMKNNLIRTDLAVEAYETYIKDKDEEQIKTEKGYKFDEQDYDGVKVSYLTVDDKGQEFLGKKKGHYITIEARDITDHDNVTHVEKIFMKSLVGLLEDAKIQPNMKCLIVGLGNDRITPDALGPMIIERVLVTQHMFTLHPEQVEEGFRPVSAISPGVMGSTGIETSDIINAVIEKTKPDFVIAIDALAAQSINRVNKTIQMTNTGIHPGSGVGNKRKELSHETLGIPVIAIGVPTVVDAVTIVSDTMDYMIKHFSYENKEKDNPSKKLKPVGAVDYTKYVKEEDIIPVEHQEKLLGLIGTLDMHEKKQLIHEVLTPIGYNLMVTPKEIDFSIEKLSELMASAIDAALHKKIALFD